MSITGGTVSVPSTVISTNTCTDVPITWSLPSMPDDWYWRFDLESTTDSSMFETGTGPEDGSDDVSWCQDDLPGSFDITGTFEVYDGDYTKVATSDIDLTFRVKRMKTAASAKIGDSTPKVNQITTYRGCVTANGDRQAYRAIAIEFRRPNTKWKRYKKTWTDGVGCYAEGVYVDKKGTGWFRTRVFKDGISNPSLSKSVKVRVHT